MSEPHRPELSGKDSDNYKYQMSIIIPVYNVQKYIIECLNSVFCQITNSVEVIIINDGSTDNSAEIIRNEFKDFIKKDNITFISKRNEGLARTRNVGILRAKGRYIAFLDSDDVLSPNYIETLIKFTFDSVDIVSFNYIRFSQAVDFDKNTQVEILKNDNSDFYKPNLENIFLSSKWFACFRMYKAVLFNDRKFKDNIYYEDMELLPTLYSSSHRFLHLNTPLYGYRKNPTGITANITCKHIDDLKMIRNSYLANRDVSFFDYLVVDISFVINRYEALNKLPISDLGPINVRKVVTRYWKGINLSLLFYMISSKLYLLFLKLRSLMNTSN